jgi:MoxR-like ATPase
VNPAQTLYRYLSEQIDKAVIGKVQAKAVVAAAFLAHGNVLLEGVPGIAKTLLARAFAKALGAGFARIQFTPDLMPTDILGMSVYHQAKAAFEFMPGPIFSDFILADEINRAPAKTQAALLEAMEERQVSIDSHTYLMSANFIVFATQNPLEFEGTYTLPEAQLDRFMVRVVLGYPSEEEESAIISRAASAVVNPIDSVQSIPHAAEWIVAARQFIDTVVVDQKIVAYVKNLIRTTRTLDQVLLGNSPRAGQMLIRLARAYAAIEGKEFVTPDHIQDLVPAVLPHRWVLKPEAEIQETPVEAVLKRLFDTVQVPQ